MIINRKIEEYTEVVAGEFNKRVPISAKELGTSIYLIKHASVEESILKRIIFACPCGCDVRISLSLQGIDQPHWNVKINEDSTVTLGPSVVVDGCCNSHFFLVNNKIQWC